MFKKLFFTVAISLGISCISFVTKAFAQMDISLVDNKEEETITIFVNSGYNEVAGIDMSVIFSDDVVINEINNTGNYCSMRFNSEITANRFNIECFNDSATDIASEIATIDYTKASDDYFFYVDLETLDIGNVPLRDIQNINRPEDIEYRIEEYSPTVIMEEPEKTNIEKGIEFLRENRFYVLASGIIFLLISLLVIKTSSSKKTS